MREEAWNERRGWRRGRGRRNRQRKIPPLFAHEEVELAGREHAVDVPRLEQVVVKIAARRFEFLVVAGHHRDVVDLVRAATRASDERHDTEQAGITHFFPHFAPSHSFTSVPITCWGLFVRLMNGSISACVFSA